jgi:hypothetical protein
VLLDLDDDDDLKNALCREGVTSLGVEEDIVLVDEMRGVLTDDDSRARVSAAARRSL